MNNANDIVRNLVKNYLSKHQLSAALGVSENTIERWLSDQGSPRPQIEGKIRRIYKDFSANNPSHNNLRKSLDNTLYDIREILHRRGRFSSRNQALEEFSKLLFAHFINVLNNTKGINYKTLVTSSSNEGKSAKLLRSFVNTTFDKHLPASLTKEMSPSDFYLTIKDQENLLALEIIKVFDKNLSAEFIRENIHDSDIFNEVFGQFLAGNYIDEKQLGQYLTPPEIVKFMVKLAVSELREDELNELLNPDLCHKFGLVLDPACGVGSFLTEFTRELHSLVLNKHKTTKSHKWIKNFLTNNLVGVDKSERMIKLALTNLTLFGVSSDRIHQANSLDKVYVDKTLTVGLENKVRLILTNPPFGAEFRGKDIENYKIYSKWTDTTPNKIDSEILFLERYIDWLMPGGQCVVVVPDSILTNKGIFSSLRNGIRDYIDILSVVSLPSVTFEAAGTNTKTSILHFRKKSTAIGTLPKKTFIAICNNVGYSVVTRDTQKRKIVNGVNELPEILNEYINKESKIKNIKWIDSITTSERWDATYHASLSKSIEDRLNTHRNGDLLISDIASLVNERINPNRLGDYFKYVEISDIDSNTFRVDSKLINSNNAPSRARKTIKANDVLFSTVRPERKTVGVVGYDLDGAICTTGLAVLRPKNISPILLAYLLKTEFVISQLMRNNIGIAYPAIDENCLLDVLLPIKKSELDKLNRYAIELLEKENELRSARNNFNNLVESEIHKWE